MKTLSLPFLTVTIGLFLSSFSVPFTEGNLTRYSSTEMGVSFLYDDCFVLKQIANNRIVASDSCDDSEFRANYVYTIVHGVPDSAFKYVFDMAKAEIAKAEFDAEIIATNTSSTGSENRLSFQYNCKIKGINVSGTAAAVHFRDYKTMVLISFMCGTDEFKSHLDTFDKVETSVELI